MISIMHVSRRIYLVFIVTIQFAALSLQQVNLLPISLPRIYKTFCLYFLKEIKTFGCLLLKRHIFGHAFCFSFILKINAKMIVSFNTVASSNVEWHAELVELEI